MELVSAIILLLVGSAVFMTGMNMMSGGLKKATGYKLKKLFKKTQNSRMVGFGIGALVTAIIQSSAATSVMVIGFINAGIMTIFQGVSMMMGSFVGTTVTGILVSLSSFDISIFLTAFAFVGIIMMFFKSPKVKNIGEILCGFGLIFFGLSTMSSSIRNNAQINNAISNLFTNISFPLLLMIIGVIVTALLQSSSATTGIVIVMVGSNVIPFSSALYVSIGATIGTCVTTLIATIGASTDSKRAGLIALLIKIIAGFIGLIILWIFETPIVNLFKNNFGSVEFGVAIFMLMYSIIFFAGLLPFIKPLEKLSRKMIKDKTNNLKKKTVLYIDDRFLDQPDISLMQAKKEIDNMFELARTNFNLTFKHLVNDLPIDENDINEREETIDYINNRLTDFLIKLSGNVDSLNQRKFGSYFHVINDIERIGDHAYNFYGEKTKMLSLNLNYTNQAKGELNNFYNIVNQMFDISIEIFNKKDKSNLEKLHNLEDETDKLTREYEDNHFSRMQSGECAPELSVFYSTVLSELERVGDHLTNIGYSILNPVGDDTSYTNS